MGIRFSVYEYDKEANALLPPSIVRHPTFVTNVASASRWNYELLEDRGEQKMRALVTEPKNMRQAITECTFFAIRGSQSERFCTVLTSVQGRF